MRCNEIEKKAFLAQSNFQVLNISLDGEIQVLLPISRHCHNTTGDSVESQISTDFTFSNKNRMTIVGCNVFGAVKNEDGMSFNTCATNCSSSQPIDRPCSGPDGCCQSLVHSGVNTLSLETFTLTDAWELNRCSYVFVVEDGYFRNLRNVTSFPVVLDWTIGNQTCPPVGDAGSCGKKSICINSTTASGYSCKCQHGFEGNPYLGCQGTLSQKSDVYSYGVVLMELVTGEKALCFKRPQSRKHLVAHLEFALQEDSLDEIIDPRVLKAENRREIYEVAFLATRCTQVKGEERPIMSEIATALQVLRAEGKHGSGRFLSGFEIQSSS